MRTLGVLYHYLIGGLAAVSALSIAAMAFWVTYDVICRYVLAQPTNWSTDLAGYTLLGSTFLAAPWVLSRRGHVSVDLVTSHLPLSIRRPLAVLVSLVGAAICAILAWKTGAAAFEFYDRGMMIVRAFSLPRYLPYLPIPIGSALLMVEFLRQAVRDTMFDDGLRALEASRKAHL
jgi:TRAP-type C4-dicarboxylate transport system permease small subunit